MKNWLCFILSVSGALACLWGHAYLNSLIEFSDWRAFPLFMTFYAAGFGFVVLSVYRWMAFVAARK